MTVPITPVPKPPVGTDTNPEHGGATIDTDDDGNIIDNVIVVPPDPPKPAPTPIPAPTPAPNPNTEGSFVIGIDPISAAFNAAAAFFNFLSTTQGQRIVNDIINFDEAFVKKCSEIFTKIHDKLEKDKD